METAPVLRLNPAQVAQLIGYCTEYRSSLWRYAQPTLERNQVIRCLQAFHGRLEKAQEQAQASIALLIAAEEKHTLTHLFRGLLQMYGNAPSSEERNRALEEIAACRCAIQRMLARTQPL
jgi:hypothetical protein